MKHITLEEFHKLSGHKQIWWLLRNPLTPEMYEDLTTDEFMKQSLPDLFREMNDTDLSDLKIWQKVLRIGAIFLLVLFAVIPFKLLLGAKINQYEKKYPELML